MPNDGRFAALAASAILLFVVSLAPLDAQAEEPGRPTTTGYPNLGDMPPKPEKPAITADELSKLKNQLTTARDRQRTTGKVRGGAAQAEPAKP